ncbi:MAG: membrane integrity-associated transporter subunit PqiC [Candidatus Delongbacteria bacterium]|nr:membrane integrity-associated transporter subunit PqiC [Candidatus Delongbacteria bacterium]
MNRKFVYLILIIVLASCSIKTVKEYYLVSYLPEPESLERFKVTGLPIDAKVEVQNFEMNRIYDRNSIVVRESLHKLSFDTKNNWALRPDRSLPELLIYHINAAGIFKECKSDYALTRPDYYITGVINNIEIYNGETTVLAHLNVVLELRDRNRTILVSHHINEKKDIRKYDITFFVKTIGELLRDGSHEFIIKTVDYFRNADKDGKKK